MTEDGQKELKRKLNSIADVTKLNNQSKMPADIELLQENIKSNTTPVRSKQRSFPP